MPISAYVVTVNPVEFEQVSMAISKLNGVTIGERDNNRLSVATETADEEESKNIGQEMLAISGVQAADLVYHNFEDTLEQASPTLQTHTSNG